MSQLSGKAKEGWGWPALTRRAHYFRQARSLCGRWMYQGELTQGNDDSNDNCTTCKKLYQKELGNPPVVKQ